MSATASRPAEPAPASTTFSYAQAAKGQTTSSAVAVVHSSQAMSGVSTPIKDSISTSNTPSASVNGGATSEGGEHSVNGGNDSAMKTDAVGSSVDLEVKSNPQVDSGSLTNSPSFGTASTSTLPKEEDLALAGGVPPEPVWDRNFPPASGTDKAPEAVDGRRGKKGKKQKNIEKEAEKDKEELKPEVFVAAPVPTVNIWEQRREAQAAKTKPNPSIPRSSQAPDSSAANESALGQTAKPADTKRRGKSIVEEGEKILGTAQNGGAKDSSNTSKGQKKSSDGTVRAKEDATRRAGPRGSRVSEKDEKFQPSQVPPPVEDAMSWPTPETALEEEKRKAQERSEKEEKDDTASNKPRPKEKWVPVPYIPTVTFNTPLPTRGGRGRGGARVGRESGGRGNHAANGGGAGERVNHSSTTATNPGGDLENRGRGVTSAPRASSLPPNSTKRTSSDALERRSPVAPTVEKSKSGQANAPTKGQSGTTVSSQPEQSMESHQNQQVARGDNSKKQDLAPGTFHESNSKSSTADRRGEPSVGGSDQLKDNANLGKDNSQARDRADGRSDRGRGGSFRGRGGHNNYPNGQHPQHTFTNGHGPQPPNGFPIRQSLTAYSPTIQQPPFSNQYAQTPSRGGRGSSRSQSIPNVNMYGRFPAGAQPMTPLQTSNPMFDFQSIPSISATPYNPYNIDHYSVLAMVTMQLEYYFSIDNLCKDVFLRKHMDSQGFVFVTFIAGFKRIQALTQDFELLRYACHESDLIDIIRGEDGIDRLRRKEGWEKWVLAMEERDESTRNAGPLYHHRQQPQRSQHVGQMILPGIHGMSPPAFSPNGAEPSFRPYGNETPIAPVVNGTGNNYHPETPLSATVPDFAPGLPPLNGDSNSLEDETTFSDEQVAELTLVFNSPKGSDNSTSSSPVQNTRTFSNGSIDGISIAEEILDNQHHVPNLTNGSRASESASENQLGSRSPFTPLSPTKTLINNAPPVMWVKGKRQQALVSEDSPREKYSDVRARALKNRESTEAGETHHDMKVLYEFWSHFLCRNFNPTMYSEFRKYAFEDVRDKAVVGMRCLISYYDEILNSKKKVIPDTLALHYIELVNYEKINGESNGDRPAFNKLRAAWRNGALDLKSRKKIDNLLHPKLKEELER